MTSGFRLSPYPSDGHMPRTRLSLLSSFSSWYAMIAYAPGGRSVNSRTAVPSLAFVV